MSSSARAQYEVKADTLVSDEAASNFEVFLYPEAASLPAVAFKSGSSGTANQMDAHTPAWAGAIRESEERARSSCLAALALERGRLARALEDFSRQRAVYFLAVEREAVQLVLAIAHKVLQREARVDPLALAAMVHVALEPLHTGTAVTLCVHPSAAQDWRLYFAARDNALPQLETPPQVVEDVGVPVGECLLKTEMGTARLSLSQQMESIEASFLDLLAQRPTVAV